MHGRAHVVPEARKGELFGAGPTAEAVCGLENQDAPPGFGQGDGSDEAIRPRSDDDSIDIGGGLAHDAYSVRAAGKAFGQRSPEQCANSVDVGARQLPDDAAYAPAVEDDEVVEHMDAWRILHVVR